MSKGLITALLISTVLALALSFLPAQALERWGGQQFEARTSGDVTVMSMDKVVDELGTLQLGSHLQQVVWEQDRLVIMLAVPASKLRQNQHKPWSDIYKIAHRFLVEVPQHRAVEVRVVTYEHPELVQLSVSADRSDMVGAPKPDSQAIATFVQQKLDVIEKNMQSK
ncbi:hypothetical protein CIG75_09625 [Tumebacillus algifaecis]|uniref:Uncharacterized protein n=1 Tax=Tumebacillus algifaecis TaxID=1214604 RepID=A0A223D1F2_9BACL|nr:hypothetical protein [Tumebacillus algifaecis]ASS75214.1 hypothetical protein CIG75_09625 [Tumebacillus algifaecis]